MHRHWTAGALLLLLAGCSNPPPPQPQKSAEPARIVQFYAATPRIAKGERTQLCYGLEGASAVRLEPAVEKVWPALSRCFEVAPAATTTYTLTAEDSSGQTVSQKATIEVGPARPGGSAATSGTRMIGEVTVSKLDIARGEQVTICYTARNAKAVTITPGQGVGHTAERGCITDRPTETTTYSVIATGPGGEKDSERVTVKVR